jgi:hypothetical protein
MAAYLRVILSGSTNGKAIKVVAVATVGTLLHTAVSGTVDMDEVWLWAQNNNTTAIILTLEWGEATAPDGNIIMTIPAKSGPYLIAPGLMLQNGLEIRAFADTANKISIHGYVNRLDY